MKTPLLALVAVTSITSTALAKGKADPKLPKEIQPMYCLVGEWKSQNAVAVLDGKKHKVDFTVSCAPTSGGMGLLCSTKFDIEGLGHIEETDLFGYDPGQNRYHWFSVTQMGETHDHVALAPAPSDKGITFSYTGFQNGKPMQEVVSMTFLDEAATRIDFKNDGVIAGQPAWKITATMIKK
jgi:hypothetical protein